MTTPRMRTGFESDEQVFECCKNDSPCGSIGRVCLLFARWFPIFFVFTLLISSIYIFFVRLCIDFLIYGDIPRVTQGALYICAYWCLFVMVVYCFIRAAFGDPRSPDQFNIRITSSATEEIAAFQEEQYRPVQSPDQIVYLPRSTARICGICSSPKPPRTHHCSTCKKCFLKMDHHCVWLDNCVGWGNYKPFYCLLFWATFFCGFVFGALLEALIQQLVYHETTGFSIVWIVMTVLAFALGVSTLMLLGYHSYLIAIGTTTIEHIEEQEELEDRRRKARIRRRQKQLRLQEQERQRTESLQEAMPLQSLACEEEPPLSLPDYSEGLYRNISAALGPNPLLWLFPYNNPTGNGIRFRREEASRVHRQTAIV